MAKKLYLIVFLFLTGCSGTPELGGFFSVDDFEGATDGRARIVFLKHGENALPNYAGSNVEVSVNGQWIGELYEKSYFVYDISPATYDLTFSVPLLERPIIGMHLFADKHVKLKVEANKVYYIHYEVVAEPPTEVWTGEYYELSQSFTGVGVFPIEAEQAHPILFECQKIIEFD
ncbi:DUF2846 domain-containing protein [Neiella marina]|uniref:DUF2846 domain-containing protein n=1 Tax=Neiella holothuriorum TaxID=2870530 RepID=A0ABS7EKG0_9GAMM|nr:DUF2846 domain-containing protein [Neiella holothuriorum]MBW8192719.1 DUF2846 domain-containing protein [Neiella holothuriorum]